MKITARKLISFSLALLLALSILPAFPAFSAGVMIMEVPLNVVMPTAGKYPTFAKVNDEHYESRNDDPAPASQTNGVVWTNEKTGVNLTISNVFRADCTYTFSISLYAKDGYAFSSDTKAAVNGKEATVTLNSTKNVTVTLSGIGVKFNNPFTDVPDGKWYTDAALYCNFCGFMTGTTETTFSPDMDFSRAMFVTVLSKIDGADTSDCEGSHFTDVPEGKWYSKPVEWAYRNNYASGTGNGCFSPMAPVTRETIAQFFYNYTAKKGGNVSVLDDLSAYTDAGEISGWAKTAVQWAVASELISGTSATTLSPKGTASRAQVAVIVKKFTTTIVWP